MSHRENLIFPFQRFKRWIVRKNETFVFSFLILFYFFFFLLYCSLVSFLIVFICSVNSTLRFPSSLAIFLFCFIFVFFYFPLDFLFRRMYFKCSHAVILISHFDFSFPLSHKTVGEVANSFAHTQFIPVE